MVVRLHAFYCPTPLHNTMNQSLGMKEPILYNKYGICITSSILRKGPSEYPTRDIRGVRLVEREKNKTLPVLLSTAGILLIAFKLYLPGVALLAAGLAWFLRTQDEFLVVVDGCPTGEKTFKFKTERCAQEFLEAVNRLLLSPAND